MPSLGEIIRGLTKLAEEGYVFTSGDRCSLMRLASSLKPAERKVLYGVLKDLGVELEINDKLITKSIVESWTALAEIWKEEYGYDEIVKSLECLYKLENPIDDYPLSLEEDITVAGMLYKGDHRYDTLLSYFSPDIAANVYLVHYKHKLKSIKAFYTLMEVAREWSVYTPYEILEQIFSKMSSQRIFGFLTRMKSKALNVLGEDKCRRLGTIIFKSFVRSFDLSHSFNLYMNEMLHLTYILGLDPEELREMQPSEFIEFILDDYEISKPLYMKYRGLGEFNLLPEELESDYWERCPMYSSIVGEEGERLYREFYEYVHQIRSEV